MAVIKSKETSTVIIMALNEKDLDIINEALEAYQSELYNGYDSAPDSIEAYETYNKEVLELVDIISKAQEYYV